MSLNKKHKLASFFGVQDVYLFKDSRNPTVLSTPDKISKNKTHKLRFGKYKKTNQVITSPRYINFQGTPDFGRKTITSIPCECDYIKDCYLYVELPPLPQQLRWCPYIGEALINEIQLEIGGAMIDRQYKESLHIHSELYLNDNERKKYHSLIGHQKSSSENLKLLIPLRFYFNANEETPLYIQPAKHHTIRINLGIEHISNCIQVVEDVEDVEKLLQNIHIEDVQLLVHECFIGDPKTRNEFLQTSKEQLIEQLQFTGIQTLNKHLSASKWHDIPLTFNHPVKELFFFCKQHNKGLSSETDNLKFIDCIEEVKLKFNGCDVFDLGPLNKIYFTELQQFKHHSGRCDNLWSYSFANHPQKYQPSGSINFSQIDNPTLHVTLKPEYKDKCIYLYVFATSLTVLRTMSGMSGLAYSK